MSPVHHPCDGLLLDYASGALSEPVALAVATHIALCDVCQASSARLDALGGALLEDLEPAAMSQRGLERVMARLDEEPAAPEPILVAPQEHGDHDAVLPSPLHRYVEGGLPSLRWRSYGGLSEARLLKDGGGFSTRLIRLKPGAAAPRHTHERDEFTVVLTGAFSDSRALCAGGLRDERSHRRSPAGRG
ncbi:MAG: ChrR family anti-sigma-E factor [Caulobacterales bacterium]|nr:ChrR family anti-sigma-E factor [Caulobacterales bacterium]